MTTRDELAGALTDVRRAYRLLHGYHRRVNGLFAQFDKAVEAQDFEFVQWAPVFFGRPRNKSGKFWDRRWAWDLLPGYGLGAVYQRKEPTPLRRILFQVVADDAYTWGRVQPLPKDFDPVEDCQSLVHIGLWTAEDSRFQDRAAWAALRKLENPWDGSCHPVEVAGRAYSYALRTVDLSEITTDDAFSKLVVAPTRAWAVL